MSSFLANLSWHDDNKIQMYQTEEVNNWRLVLNESATIGVPRCGQHILTGRAFQLMSYPNTLDLICTLQRPSLQTKLSVIHL